jgi:hypothetical protein
MNSARMAYVFLVNQLCQEIFPQDSAQNEKMSLEEKAMSVAVSSFAAPLA